MSQQPDRFFWAKPRNSEHFEPASVNCRDGKPYEVWFIGMDVQFDANDCIIGEEIQKPEGLQ